MECVTMLDVLEQQAAIEEDAHAVLAGSDDACCTYDQGYVRRQALYACVTCAPTSPAAVCLACSLRCHDRHELVELYTKRNFRCDCGGPPFGERACHFGGRRAEPNERNRYDHNFSGVYCVCDRPYPDPDATQDDEMIQCVVCEDWLHSRHLGVDAPRPERYSEMICAACFENNDFLADYLQYAVPADDVTVDDAERSEVIDANESVSDEKLSLPTSSDEPKPQSVSTTRANTNTDETEANATEPAMPESSKTASNTFESNKIETETIAVEPDTRVSSTVATEQNHSETRDEPVNSETKLESTETCSSTQESDSKRKLEINHAELDNTAKRARTGDSVTCIRPKNDASAVRTGAVFWCNDWRSKLCTCSSCTDTYERLKVQFLLDADDTVTAYENLGKSKSATSQYEKGLEALSSLDRVQQINAITEYNKMKEKLLEFLKTFKDKREVVKEEDIKDFFAGMKPKREPDGVYFCR